MVQLSLPLSVRVGRKTKTSTGMYSCNLNNYRNAHHAKTSKAKIIFKESIWKDLQDLPQFGRVAFLYTLYPKTNRECDVMNFGAVVDKFFSDAFVEAAKLHDDNYKYLPEVGFQFGSVDPANPRMEVLIHPLDN